MSDSVLIETDGPVTIVTINRPHARNAVDRDTAGRSLRRVPSPSTPTTSQYAAVLTGADGNFCAGADLKAVAQGAGGGRPSRRTTKARWGRRACCSNKPVIAAVEGFAVAGGIELAVWCDLRVAAESATFGVYCRRWGVPLIDGGTIRLPRLIGQSHALDMILTGRGVGRRGGAAHRPRQSRRARRRGPRRRRRARRTNSPSCRRSVCAPTASRCSSNGATNSTTPSHASTPEGST